jgi:hypothetical protein
LYKNDMVVECGGRHRAMMAWTPCGIPDRDFRRHRVMPAQAGTQVFLGFQQSLGQVEGKS